MQYYRCDKPHDIVAKIITFALLTILLFVISFVPDILDQLGLIWLFLGPMHIQLLSLSNTSLSIVSLRARFSKYRLYVMHNAHRVTDRVTLIK